MLSKDSMEFRASGLLWKMLTENGEFFCELGKDEELMDSFVKLFKDVVFYCGHHGVTPDFSKEKQTFTAFYKFFSKWEGLKAEGELDKWQQAHTEWLQLAELFPSEEEREALRVIMLYLNARSEKAAKEEDS